jgi:hypothetical protein
VIVAISASWGSDTTIRPESCPNVRIDAGQGTALWREDELLGLRSHDVDLDALKPQVVGSLQNIAGGD